MATGDGPAWLRLASAPNDQRVDTFWNGSIDAEDAIPVTVPRPRLRAVHDWQEGRWSYRAELYDRAPVRAASRSAVLSTNPNVCPHWWNDLRSTLDAISTVRTSRLTAFQPFLDHAMPRYLGTPVDTRAPSWSTAHGDLHFANLGAPAFHLFDWEGWGMAPAGYDAAMLHSYSLLVPMTAARIRAELAHVLDTPAGRFAELAVITELLHGTARGDNTELREPLRNRAQHLLGRTLTET
ncbi:aminoglycoside phosphotransferase/kinase family protein [Nocardiopsis quinghaiensis]|uniref:phosphotransferase n=1 Tax=Nocardiopsis quinghaiensis TaxID=464995 RepID=UPI001CC25B72|nr:phosphotransferase [Nocardiopsis quinghaiensis]